MQATAEQKTMPKPRGRPRRSERDDMTVKFDRTLVGMAQMIAKARGISLAEYLSEAGRPVIERDFGKEMRRLSEGKA